MSYLAIGYLDFHFIRSRGWSTIVVVYSSIICLVIPILSLLLFIQSLYSLSKLLVPCPLFAAFRTAAIGLIKHYCSDSEVKGLTKQLWFIIILSSKTYCSTCVLLQAAPVPMDVYMYIVMSCIMVMTELKGLTKKSS